MEVIQFMQSEMPYAVREEIKSLRTNLQFCGTDKKIIMVTSTLPSEGKSSVSYELSRSLTELGKRVFLVDADLRRSNFYKRTSNRTAKHKGLSGYLSGQEQASDVMFQAEDSSMVVMFAGPVPPSPAELLSNERMKKLLQWAREQFDYVIIDSPPVNSVTDAAVLAPLCDGILFVVRSEAVPVRAAQNAIEQLQRSGCPVLGVVLNQRKNRGKGHYSKYYKKYGYYTKYGYEDKPSE